jgi:hypothetical protein
VAGKMAYPALYALPYNRIIAFTEIYIPQGWASRRTKSQNDQKITGEVVKLAGRSFNDSNSAFALYC